MSNEIALQVDAVKEFADEVSGQVAEAEVSLLSWASPDAPPDTVDGLFRTFHNIKGTSGMFGLAQLQEVFHNGESLLAVYREKRARPTEDVSELLIQVLDEFKKICAHVVEHGTEPPERPYALMARLVEAKRAANAGAAETAAEDEGGAKKEQKVADDSIRISARHGVELVEIVSDFIQLQNRVEVVLGDDGASTNVRNEIQRFSSRLQSFVLGIRLSPIQPLLAGLQRTASAAARDLGKRYRMQITGGDTQLDRKVIDLLRDPLIHMIRNSLDHGLETPDQRAAARKPPEGLIVFEAFQQAGQVVLTLSDDGRGMDPARLKAKALEKGLISAKEAELMPDREALRLVLLPGFSTAAAVTSYSGRGVGMDAVKTSVESIGGAIDIDSTLGRGSKITLTLPLTLAIVKSLAFKVGQHMYAVPQTCVEEVVITSTARNRGQLSDLDGGQFLHLRRAVVPIVPARRLFKVAHSVDDPVFVVIRHRNERFALEVDAIVGPRDFVSQPLPEAFAGIDVLGGVNQLNSGEYISLLDLAAISRLFDKNTLSSSEDTDPAGRGESDHTASDIFRSQQKLVFFKSGKLLAVPVQTIRQVIQVPAACVESVGERVFITHEGRTYPVLRVSQYFDDRPLLPCPSYAGLIVQREGHMAVILCEEFHGIHRLPSSFETLVTARGIQGSVNHQGRTHLVPNVTTLFSIEFADRFTDRKHGASKFRVLVVEDDPFFATSLSDFLKHEGIAVVVAKDGLEAQECLQRTLGPEGEFIDMVITDYEMPRRNGLELLAWMRQHESFSTTPVIMCTAVGDDITRRAATKLGIDYFAGKMKYEQLLPFVLRRRSGSDIGVTADVGMEIPAEGGAPDTDHRALIFDVGGQRCGIQIAHLKEISSASRPTRVPGLPACAANMIGFRGHPIPVVDLRLLAGVSAAGAPQQIVAKFQDFLCALWVDKVHNVRRTKKMDRASALIKSQLKKQSSGNLATLIGDVLWDNEAVALIDADRVAKLLVFLKERTPKLTLDGDDDVAGKQAA